MILKTYSWRERPPGHEMSGGAGSRNMCIHERQKKQLHPQPPQPLALLPPCGWDGGVGDLFQRSVSSKRPPSQSTRLLGKATNFRAPD